MTVGGSIKGSAHIEHDGTLIIESGGKLAGSLHNDGAVIVRGVFGGSRMGSGELRFEDGGYEKAPDRIEGNRRYYNWS